MSVHGQNCLRSADAADSGVYLVAEGQLLWIPPFEECWNGLHEWAPAKLPLPVTRWSCRACCCREPRLLLRVQNHCWWHGLHCQAATGALEAQAGACLQGAPHQCEVTGRAREMATEAAAPVATQLILDARNRNCDCQKQFGLERFG